MVAAARFELAPPKRLVFQEIYRLHIYKILFCEIKGIERSSYKYGNFTSAIFCIEITGVHNIGGHRFLAEQKGRRITQLNRKTYSETVIAS